jgi:hypothetical protein
MDAGLRNAASFQCGFFSSRQDQRAQQPNPGRCANDLNKNPETRTNND